MYRLIAIDLDDTLLADNLEIHPKNIETLKKAKEKGVHVVLCSGRENNSMLRIMDIMNIFNREDYYISYNGAMVQTAENEVLWKDKIEGEDLKRFIEIGRKYNPSIQCYCDGLVFDRNDDRIQKYQQNNKIEGKQVEDLLDLEYSIKLLFNSNDLKKLAELKLELEKEFGNKFHYFFSKPNYLEVLNKHSNKGLAVKFLAEYLKIKPKEVICIGDSFNDAYMIEYAGLGVAMQNANPKVKEVADYVTEKTNNEGGIAEVVEKYILNE